MKRLPFVCSLFVGLFLLTACGRSNHDKIGHLPAADEKQRSIATHATIALRELVNNGSCAAIYGDASPGFRSQPLGDWLDQCEQWRKELGSWKKFVVNSATTCDMANTVCLDGSASFEKDQFDVIVGWKLENMHPELLFVTTGRTGKTWSQMPPGKQNLLDVSPEAG